MLVRHRKRAPYLLSTATVLRTTDLSAILREWKYSRIPNQNLKLARMLETHPKHDAKRQIEDTNGSTTGRSSVTMHEQWLVRRRGLLFLPLIAKLCDGLMHSVPF